MARKAVAVAVLIFSVVLLVCAMPPTQTGSMSPSPPRARLALHGGRLQCPSCLKDFKSERALRQHRAALGRVGMGTQLAGCAGDTRQSLLSAWSGDGRGAAGRVRNLAGQSVHLPGMTDSESDGDERDERVVLESGGQGDEPHDVVAPPLPVPDVVAPPLPVQIHTYTYIIRTHTYIYIHIHTKYVHIRTYTYIYRHGDIS